MKNSRLLFIIFSISAVLIYNCTSRVTYHTTMPDDSVIEAIAKTAGVSKEDLKKNIEGMFDAALMPDPEDYPILSCVADILHDGRLDLSDVTVFARQYSVENPKSCADIAAMARSDGTVDDNLSCMNLFRDESSLVNIDDLSVFTILYRGSNAIPGSPDAFVFRSSDCNNPSVVDGDGLPPYTEAWAWVNTSVLDYDTYPGDSFESDYAAYLALLNPQCFVDADGDGFLEARPDCPASNNDCNDASPAVHPGAIEICGNGIDENCDGTPDDGCVSCDIDADSDGYYAASCGGNDCNDSNPNINPGRAEICGNSVDENCDGSSPACPPEGSPSINGLSGIFRDGNIATISGSNFGVKDPVAPAFYDDLTAAVYSGLNSGDIVPTGEKQDGYPWSGHFYSTVYYRTENPRFSGQAYYYVAPEDVTKGALVRDDSPGYSHEEAPNFYLDWWFWTTTDFNINEYYEYEGNTYEPKDAKFTRFWMDSDVSRGQLIWESDQILGDWAYSGNYVISQRWGHWAGNTYQWNHMASIMISGSDIQSGTGISKNYVDADRFHEPMSFAMGEAPNYFRLLGVDTKILSDTDPSYGWSDSCEVDEDGHGWCFPGQEMKFGEVYFDITLARIVIADSPNFNMEDRNRFHYEVQLPTAWSQTSASFKVKKGTFENNQDVWIFLFDKDGQMSQGFRSRFIE